MMSTNQDRSGTHWLPHSTTLGLGVCLALAGGLSSLCSANEEQPKGEPAVQQAPAPEAANAGPAPLSLPEFDFQEKNGLYATISAMSVLPKEKLEHEQMVKLKDIKGFERSLNVRVLWQKQPAPLAVLLLGLDGSSRAPLARLWQTQMFEAGCHVLVFDSAFRPAFNEQSRHGVPGNLEVEGELIAHVIKRFMETEDAAQKITKVGLLGASYGGLLALNVAKLARAKKIDLVPARILVFSPPVNTRTTAEILDVFAEADRPKYSLVELSRLIREEHVEAGNAIPHSDSLMRAGLGHEFRLDLERAVKVSEELYGMQMPPMPVSLARSEFQEGRRVFTRFVECVAYPYWQKKMDLRDIDEFWRKGDLASLLEGASAEIHVVLAIDDPLNKPEALNALKASVPAERLTLLPRGGHLGFMASQWAKARVQQLFK